LAIETEKPVTLADEDIEVEVVTRRSLLLKTGLVAGLLGGAALAGASSASAQGRRRISDPEGDETDNDPSDGEEDSGPMADVSDAD
jgi:hypothetical protein